MRKGEVTRLEIIQHAAPIFNQQGYAGSSMADVMKATGLQKGGIYNHFESKEQLAQAAFRYSVERVRQQYAEALQEQGSAPSQLLALIDTFQRCFHEPPVPGGCPLLNTAIDCDDTFPALRQQASREMKHWHSWIARIIRQGISRGELRANVDAKAAATLFIACLEGGLMLSKLHDDPLYLQQAIAHLRFYVTSSLTT